jgi:hypothetical protein
MLTVYYVPPVGKVAGLPRPQSHPLINEMRRRGRLGYVSPPVPLHDGETSRYLERQLVVPGGEDLHPTAQLVRWRAGGTWRPGRARAARLNGQPRPTEMFTRRLEIVSPLVGNHRLVPGWSRLVARPLGGGR